MTQRYHFLAAQPESDRYRVQPTRAGATLPTMTADRVLRPSELSVAFRRIGSINGVTRAVPVGVFEPVRRVFDWLCVVDLDDPTWREGTETLTEGAPLNDLIAGRWAEPIQATMVTQFAHALEKSVTPSPAPLHAGWRAAVRDWIGSSLGRRPSSIVFERDFRLDPSYVVSRIRWNEQAFYFKAAAPPNVEALATTLLADTLPNAYAPTLAIDSTRGWWLSGSVVGHSLRGRLRAQDLFSVATTLADTQRMATPANTALVALGVDAVDENWIRRSLDRLGTWIETLVQGSHLLGTSALALVESLEAMCREACNRTCSCSNLKAFIHLDLAPDNIFVIDGRIAFIDLCHAAIGPAHLALAGFVAGLSSAGDYSRFESRRELVTRTYMAALGRCAPRTFNSIWRDAAVMYHFIRATQLHDTFTRRHASGEVIGLGAHTGSLALKYLCAMLRRDVLER